MERHRSIEADDCSSQAYHLGLLDISWDPGQRHHDWLGKAVEAVRAGIDAFPTDLARAAVRLKALQSLHADAVEA